MTHIRSTKTLHKNMTLLNYHNKNMNTYQLQHLSYHLIKISEDEKLFSLLQNTDYQNRQNALSQGHLYGIQDLRYAFCYYIFGGNTDFAM